MTEKVEKQLIGMAFVKAKNELNLDEPSTTKLSTKIADDDKIILGERTIRNIFNYYFNNTSKSIVSSENALLFINYIFDKNFRKKSEAEKHFIDNAHSQGIIDKELSYLITDNKEENKGANIVKEVSTQKTETFFNNINNNDSVKKDSYFNFFTVYALAAIVILCIVFGFYLRLIRA